MRIIQKNLKEKKINIWTEPYENKLVQLAQSVGGGVEGTEKIFS